VVHVGGDEGIGIDFGRSSVVSGGASEVDVVFSYAVLGVFHVFFGGVHSVFGAVVAVLSLYIGIANLINILCIMSHRLQRY